MKVSELISLLELQPRDNQVYFYDDNCEVFKSLQNIEQIIDSKGKITSINLVIGE